jgi:predicted transcriptional regulator
MLFDGLIPIAMKTQITFKQYLNDRKMRPRHFALKHKLVQSTVWKASRGKPLRPKQAYDIYVACDKQINFFALLGIEE